MTVFSCFYIKVGNLTQKNPQKPKKIELRTFLVTVSKTDEFSELQDPEWESDLPFGVDVIGHQNNLNLKNVFSCTNCVHTHKRSNPS